MTGYQRFDYDATIVRRLREAGAVLVAKLSLGALALNDIWFGGQTMNPWLLEEGALPYERTTGGRHRRIRLQDVVSYQQRKRGERRASLSDLVGEASSAGLYDQKAESYREALRQARADLRGERG